MGDEQGKDDLVPPSALRVQEWKGLNQTTGQDDQPGQLYFFKDPGYKQRVPADQAAAQLQLDDFVSRLSIAFQPHNEETFRKFFVRVLTIAMATFSPAGFHPDALKGLEVIKKEVVQVAGAKIKADYVWGLVKNVLWANLGILVVSLLIQVVVSYGTVYVNGGEPVATTPATAEKAIGKVAKWPADFSVMHTGLLMAASMWGLLVSCMLRNMDPTFDTLLVPETDLMRPWFRLLLFGILIFVFAMLFQLRVVTLSFGEIASTAQIESNAVAAILFGLLLGVGERALPGEVQQLAARVLRGSRPTQ